MSRYNVQYDKEICPDGICTKPVKSHHRAGNYLPDTRGICGGKIIRVYVRYGPNNKIGEFSTYEELACSKCRWKKRLRLISKNFVKAKNEIWIKYKKKKRKNYQNRRRNERE